MILEKVRFNLSNDATEKGDVQMFARGEGVHNKTVIPKFKMKEELQDTFKKPRMLEYEICKLEDIYTVL